MINHNAHGGHIIEDNMIYHNANGGHITEDKMINLNVHGGHITEDIPRFHPRVGFSVTDSSSAGLLNKNRLTFQIN